MLYLSPHSRAHIRKRRARRSVVGSSNAGKITLLRTDLPAKRKIPCLKADLSKNNFRFYPFFFAFIQHNFTKLFYVFGPFTFVYIGRIFFAGCIVKRRHLLFCHRCFAHNRIRKRCPFCFRTCPAASGNQTFAVGICLNFIIVCSAGNYFIIRIRQTFGALYCRYLFISSKLRRRAVYLVF